MVRAGHGPGGAGAPDRSHSRGTMQPYSSSHSGANRHRLEMVLDRSNRRDQCHRIRETGHLCISPSDPGPNALEEEVVAVFHRNQWRHHQHRSERSDVDHMRTGRPSMGSRPARNMPSRGTNHSCWLFPRRYVGLFFICAQRSVEGER